MAGEDGYRIVFRRVVIYFRPGFRGLYLFNNLYNGDIFLFYFRGPIQRLEQKQQEVRNLKDCIRILGRAIEDKAGDADFEWLKTYAAGLRLLDDYDHETLDLSSAFFL